MNRKVLGMAVVLMAVAMLTTPVVGIAKAGKGQEKQYFKIYLVGLPDQSTGEIRWTPDPITGPIKHGRDVEWDLVDVFAVTIGSDTITEGISYSCKICADYNSVTSKGIQRIREIITFSDIDGEEGTLEILAIGKLGDEGATFTGHGTGALEGVKVGGTTWGSLIPWSGGGPPVRLEVTREGTVRGWP